jgi:uncharacterized protein YdhG (YjbR/CyaY superfamily)
MNMFKPNTSKSPEEYISKIEDPSRKEEIQKLHALIRRAVPDLKPFMIVGMIGYGLFHYKSPSGREGDWYIIGLASNKNYISVYVCASDGKQYTAEKYKKELAPADIGRSCIRFKKTSDIDLKILEKVIKEGAKSPMNAV